MFFGTILGIFIGKKYDYIFGFNMSALTGMVPAVVIKKLYNKPLTFWAQDIWPGSVYAYGFKKTKILSYCLDKFVSFMYHNITAIAISSKRFESKLKPYSKSNLTFNYLPNWADDLDLSLKAYKFSEEPKTQFTFAGNIGKVQNLENIIKAFDLIPPSYQNNIQLNIIGDGSNLKHLKDISSHMKNIVFHGKKPREDMAMYYKSSDFLIISLINKPTFSSIVPAKTQTYIAAKKPILAIINGETADLIKEQNLGYCVGPENIEEIKESFIKCINTDKDTIIKFTQNCEHLTNTIFNKIDIINSLEKLTINN